MATGRWPSHAKLGGADLTRSVSAC